MTQELYTYGSGDVRVQFQYGPQKEYSKFVMVSGISMERDTTTGSIYGIFEIGTAFYDNDSDLFESENFQNDFDVIVSPRKFVLNPLAECTNVKIKNKKLFVGSSGTVYTQYYFSNRPDWRSHEIKLEKRSELLDPLYRIARAIEDVKKKMDLMSSVGKEEKPVDPSDMTLSVEEFTALRLKGKIPDRYLKAKNNLGEL